MKKCIVTVVGKDTGYFNMMMVVDISEIEKDFKVICDEMEQMGEEIGVKIQCQKEEIFEKTHRL